MKPNEIIGFREIQCVVESQSSGDNFKSKKKLQKRKIKQRIKKVYRVRANGHPFTKSKTVQSSILSYFHDSQPSNLSNSELMPWRHMNLPICILQALNLQGFTEPTSIQEEIIPSIINSDKHVAIAASTGSGKTLCFGIPIIVDLIKKGFIEDPSDRIHSLILTPTRELAIQVKDHLLKLCKYIDLKILCLVGGISEVKQIRLLKRKPHIIIATPGRLWNLYNMGIDYLSNEYTGIQNISSIVLDEADRLFEHAHFSELRSVLEVVRETKKRCFFLSATLETENSITDLVSGPCTVFRTILGALALKPNQVRVFDHRTTRQTVDGLSEKRIMCSFDEKDIYLYYVIQTRRSERTLLFANSISSIKRLASLLTALNMKPFVLHAKMSQKQRLKNLEVFSGCKEAVLLATDVAARGLDIPHVNLVIHYQLPRSVILYVHRSGRTARGSIKTGNTILMVCPEEAAMYQSLVEKLNRGKQIEQYAVDFASLSAYRQIVVTTRRIEKLTHLIKRESTNFNWFSKMANECDIHLDDNLCDKQDYRETSVVSYQNELNGLIKRQQRQREYLQAQLEQKSLRQQLCGKYT